MAGLLFRRKWKDVLIIGLFLLITYDASRYATKVIQNSYRSLPWEKKHDNVAGEHDTQVLSHEEVNSFNVKDEEVQVILAEEKVVAKSEQANKDLPRVQPRLKVFLEENPVDVPKYSIVGLSNYLGVLFEFMRRLGYQLVTDVEDSGSKLIWAYKASWSQLENAFKEVRADQKINKIPGLKPILYKRALVTSGAPYLPRAFVFPDKVPEFLQFVDANPSAKFVLKGNRHRAVRFIDEQVMKTIRNGFQKLDRYFAQEFVHPPFLIDGHRFDITIYTYITSIDPLRFYALDDYLIRFCPAPYHPFNTSEKGKFVTEDHNATLIYKMPSLSKYVQQGFEHREALAFHLESLGKDPRIVFDQMEDIIRKSVLSQYQSMLKETSHYSKNKYSFFQTLRTDFILDEELNVYLMEFNGSPFLGRGRGLLPNQTSPEYIVFYNSLRLLGLLPDGAPKNESYRQSMDTVRILEQDLSVFHDECASPQCLALNCQAAECRLCHTCLNPEQHTFLRAAAFEHRNQNVCRRLYPKPPRDRAEAERMLSDDARWTAGDNMTENDVDMQKWYLAKCIRDLMWCREQY